MLIKTHQVGLKVRPRLAVAARTTIEYSAAPITRGYVTAAVCATYRDISVSGARSPSREHEMVAVQRSGTSAAADRRDRVAIATAQMPLGQKGRVGQISQL